MKQKIYKIIGGVLAVFIFCFYVHIFLLEATLLPPKDGAELYSYTHSDGTRISLFFLPKDQLIIAYGSDDSMCFQLLQQRNRSGRIILGNFYYLEGSESLFDFLRAPDGYTPYLYELEALSTLGVCEKFPKTGSETKLILHHKKGSLIYYGKELKHQKDIDEEAIQELLKVLVNV